jgi:hypothetical protein
VPTTPSVPWLRSKALLVDVFFVIFLWDEKLTIEHMGLMMVNLWDIMGFMGHIYGIYGLSMGFISSLR